MRSRGWGVAAGSRWIQRASIARFDHRIVKVLGSTTPLHLLLSNRVQCVDGHRRALDPKGPCTVN